jgi:hypothetical protein
MKQLCDEEGVLLKLNMTQVSLESECGEIWKLTEYSHISNILKKPR